MSAARAGRFGRVRKSQSATCCPSRGRTPCAHDASARTCRPRTLAVSSHMRAATNTERVNGTKHELSCDALQALQQLVPQPPSCPQAEALADRSYTPRGQSNTVSLRGEGRPWSDRLASTKALLSVGTHKACKEVSRFLHHQSLDAREPTMSHMPLAIVSRVRYAGA
jgi:hypothetical protein